MAETEIKRLLVKIGLSTSDAKVAAKEFLAVFDEADKKAKLAAVTQKTQNAQAIADAKLQESSLRQQRLEVQKTNDELKVRQATIKAETLEIQKQIQLERQKALEARKANAGGHGGGGILDALGAHIRPGLTSIATAAGGGMAGKIVAGILGGYGTIALVEGIIHGVEGLVEEIKHFVLISGQLQQVEGAFNHLAESAGTSGEKLKSSLTAATHGLIDDMDLMKGANKVLGQNAGITADQYTKLVSSVTELARAQGKEVGPALDAVNRALLTGRFRIIAMQLGLDTATKSELQHTSGLEKHLAIQRQLNIVTDASIKKTAELGGAPAETVTEKMKQLSVASENWFEDLADATVKSEGFKIVLLALDDTLDLLKDQGPGMVKTFGEIAGAVAGALAMLVDFGARVAKLPGQIKYILEDTGILTPELEKFLKIATAIGVSQIPLVGPSLAESLLGGDEKPKPETPPAPPPEDDIDTKAKRAKAQNDLDKQRDSDKLKNQQETAKQEQAILDTSLKNHEISLEAYTAKRLLQEKVVLDAKTKSIRNQRALEQQALEENPTELDNETYKIKEAEINEKFRQQELDATAHYTSQVYQLNVKLNDDIKQATQAATTAGIQARQDSLKEQAVQIETEYKNGKLSMENYLQFKNAQIDAEASAQLELAKIKATAAVDSKKGAADLAAEEEKIERDAAAKHAEITRTVSEDRIAAEKTVATAVIQRRQEAAQETAKQAERDFAQFKIGTAQYLQSKRDLVNADEDAAVETAKIERDSTADKLQAAAKYNTTLIQIANERANKLHEIDETTAETTLKTIDDRYQRQIGLENQRAQIPGASQTASIKEKIRLTEFYINEEEKAQSLVAQDSAAWLEIQSNILKAKAELQGFNKELLNSSTAGSGLMSIIGSAFGQFGRTGGIGSAFSLGANQLSTIGAYRAPELTGRGATNLLAGLGQTFKSLIHPTADNGILKPTSERIKDFGEKLKSATEVVTNFALAMTQPQSAISGGIAGAVAGGGLGQTVGALFGVAGGPIGAAVGSIGGALLGGIMAHLRANTQKIVDGISKSFKDIQQSIQIGGTNLADGLQQMEAARQQAIAKLSGSKGGRKQLDTILPQIDQQIAQVKSQVDALTKSLQTELDVLRSPAPYQQAVQNLQGIIDKYKEFAGATNNSAEAQEYLAKSVQQYADAQKDQLSQADQAAIQDAIQLNDLYTQRQQLLDDTAKQQYDIMTAGVLTRQRTVAQTKASQLQDLKAQTDLQMQQINQQINLQKFRVDAENEIFNLTVDRVTLESQLLAMQKEQTNDEIRRIAALQVLVGSLKAGTSVADIQRLITTLGQNGLPSILEKQYSQQARQGLGGFNGEL